MLKSIICKNLRPGPIGWLHVVGYLSRSLPKDNRTYRSTHAVFFSSTNFCTRTEPQLVHTCLHKMYPPVFFFPVVLRVLAEINMSEIMHITTRDFPSSLNQAVPYMFNPPILLKIMKLCIFAYTCTLKGEHW